MRIENIPFHQNPYFTGRGEVLDRLRTAFVNAGKTPHPQVISGLGGIGKTQTALEYAYRYSKDYQYALWVKADTQDLLSSDFAKLAETLNLPLKDEKDQTLTIQAVKQWLKTHSDWLLILDNADELDSVLSFLPGGLQGHILLTSRTQATGVEVGGTELEKLSIEDGLLFLLRRSKIIGLESTSLEAVSQEIQDAAKQVVRELDGLPLALAQAAAYIEKTHCGFAGYLERYQRRRGRLLNERTGLTADHPEPVATTWSLSFEEIEKNPPAADLLRACAFLHPDAIPEDLIINGASELSPALQSITDDLIDFDDTITALFKYSLIRRNFDAQTLTIHRLVQTILRDTLDEDAQKQWAERTVRAVNRAFPAVQFSTWQICEQLLPHVQVCSIWITQWNIAFSEAAQLLHKAGKYLSERGQYIEAEQLLTQALAIYKQAVGTEHPDTASNLNDLAELYRLQGKYIQMEQTCQQALAIRERILEPMSPDTATSLHTLARSYHLQARYAEAETLYKQVLATREQVLGEEHPDTTMSFHDLALLYQDRGKYEEAKGLYKRALEIRKRALGEEHPDTATSLDNLAGLYQDQGRYEEAEPLYKQALAIKERVLGEEHPHTASSLNDLASLYRDRGRYEEAEPLYKQALEISKRVLGEEHPGTASSLNNLASLYQARGRYEEAEPLYEQALEICKRVLGEEHPNIATNLDNLAGLYRDRGRLVLAKRYHKQALSIRERVLGSKHPDTAVSLANLAALYTQENNYKQAEPLFLRALAICERVLGPEHPNTVTVLKNYLMMLLRAKRKGKAAEIRKKIDVAQAKTSKE